MRCLFAGGGIRDSWNNLVEKTSDACGMYISMIKGVFKSLSYRWETICNVAMLYYKQVKENTRAPNSQGPPKTTDSLVIVI